MKINTSLTTLALCVAAAGLGHAPSVLAQAGCGVQRNVVAKPLDEQTWKRMNDIYEDIAEENYTLAHQKLTDMTERARGSEYLKAIIQQLLGQVEWALENYDAALAAFEEAVDLNALPDQPHYSLMYQISQLYYMKDRYDDALRSLELWFCKVPAENVKASAHILRASIQAAKENWREVIPSAQAAIDMSDDPQEGWYTLKLAAYQQLEDMPGARDTLKQILLRWPNKKVYWVQLSNVYFQLKEDERALSVIALAHRKELLDKQSDFLYLSNLYSLKEVPVKSAAVLQEGIDKGIVEPSEKHLKMIADSWYIAEEMEKALVAYEKAGEAALDGDIDLRRGYILIDLERWDEARDALLRALEKGGFDDKKIGEAHLMIGMSEFNLGNFDAASAAWGRASRYPGAKSSADQWMNHLREERARRAP